MDASSGRRLTEFGAESWVTYEGVGVPTSINGWPVLSPGDSKIATGTIPGTTRKLTMRKDVLPLFLALAADYNARISDLDNERVIDDWGYAYRKSRLSSAWSDHSSGTAMDLNAAQEGQQNMRPMNWWVRTKNSARATRLKRLYEVVIWGGADECGGDYQNPRYVDWMHWSLKPGSKPDDVARVIKKLKIGSDGSRPGALQLRKDRSKYAG